MFVEGAQIHVRYEDGRVFISGALKKSLKISAQSMLNTVLEQASQRSIDLINIAAGVYAMDRLQKRARDESNEARDESNEGCVRVFRVCFHVSDYEFWVREDIIDKVSELLHFLTGDSWLITFFRQAKPHRASSVQRAIELPSLTYPKRLALYSGGLDSAAGLAVRLLESQQNYLLLTVGHQSTIRRNCMDQIKMLRGLLPQAPVIQHAWFIVHLENGPAFRMRNQESSQRARSFLFCAAAGILALACGIDRIELFENGVGSINFPLVEGALIDGFATRGAHPGFMDKMSYLLSSIYEKSLLFELPFLDWTKSEMVARLVNTPHLTQWAQRSCSCIHTSLRVPGKRHCGICAACIERRQAFRGAGVFEECSDYQYDIFSGKVENNTYFSTYLENARRWLRDDPQLKTRLHRHRILSDVERIQQKALEDLHKRHADETCTIFESFISEGLSPHIFVAGSPSVLCEPESV
jgi:7-cyano-7-deazaguanine synthase in queuosine biosynthesis